jgi:radical SAM protein (TIGR01212 family)
MPGPIYSFGDYLKQRFDYRVHKVTVNADMGCPNRDGSKATGGCIYCNNRSFNPNRVRSNPDIESQIEAGKHVVRKRTGAEKVLAYFQAYSNTYAPLAYLEDLYERALKHPGVVGLVIGTRPDCVSLEVLDLLLSYQQRGFEIWLEYGLQSAHEVTLARINRGHGFAEYADTVRKTRALGLSVCTHLILGLPGEEETMMMQSLERALDAGTDGLKFHPLHVVRQTKLAYEWKRGDVPLLDQQIYVSLVCDMLERVPADCTIHRLTGTASHDILLAPHWCGGKWQVINAIYAEMQRRGSVQGCRFANRISGLIEHRLQRQLPPGRAQAGQSQAGSGAGSLMRQAV